VIWDISRDLSLENNYYGLPFTPPLLWSPNRSFIDSREVLEYEYKQLAHECIHYMELREASDRDLVNYYKSL
jgi:hypothetical protein